MRARLTQRVWSVLGFKPIFEGSDKPIGHFRPSQTTAAWVPITASIAWASWVDWSHCRHLEIAGEVWQAPWPLFKVWNWFLLRFLLIFTDFLDFFSQKASPEIKEDVHELVFHYIWCFLWFHYIASSRAYQTCDFSVLWFVSCLIEFVNTLRNVYRWYLINALIWKGFILLFLKLPLLCPFL